jgi:hypothetical protein
VTPLISEILKSLARNPKTLAGLAQDLNVPRASVEAALLQLSRGGYILKVPTAVLACSGGGCGACSVHNLCPSADAAPEKALAGPESWQLTPKGRSRTNPPGKTLQRELTVVG